MSSQEDAEGPSLGGRPPGGWRPFLLPGITAVGVALFFLFGLGEHLTFDALRHYRMDLVSLVMSHWGLVAVIFVAVFASTTFFSLPSGTFLTLVGGFLFDTLWGGLWSLLGAMIGAAAVFLAAKSSLHDWLHHRAGGSFRAMKSGFQRSAFSYLLFLRLVPIFPFFLVNLVPAFMGMRFGSYLLATLLGILPGTAILAFAGASLSTVLEGQEAMDLSQVLTFEVILALVGLALLSLLPVVWRHSRRRQGQEG